MRVNFFSLCLFWIVSLNIRIVYLLVFLMCTILNNVTDIPKRKIMLFSLFSKLENRNPISKIKKKCSF